MTLLFLHSAPAYAADQFRTIKVGSSVITTEFVPGRYVLPREKYMQWLQIAASSVSLYFKTFPVKKLSVKVESTSGDEVGFSTADFDGDIGVIEIPVGRNISQTELLHSWQAAHEMVHLGFPLVDRDHKWVAEGMATYIEPIARMQQGDLTPQAVWGDLLDNMPRGFTESPAGLKNATSIDALYWGGAAYCLLADIEIRKKTGNKLGLQDALAGIVARGGNINSDWEVPNALKVGDEAVGVNVLVPLYQKVHNSTFRVNLPDLWKQLGVTKRGGKVVFNESASLAPIRRAINKG